MGEFPGAADLSVRVCACACACVYTCAWSQLTANVFFLPKNNSCNCGFSFCCPAAYPESPPRHSRTSQPASHLQPRVLLSWECRQRVHGEALLRFLGPSSGPRPRGAGSAGPARPCSLALSVPGPSGPVFCALRVFPGPPHAVPQPAALRPSLPPSLPTPLGQANASSAVSVAPPEGFSEPPSLVLCAPGPALSRPVPASSVTAFITRLLLSFPH